MADSPQPKKSPIKAILIAIGGATVTLLFVGWFLGARDWNPGPGPKGEYNAKLNIETSDVAEAHDDVRVIIQQSHQGQLEKENTDFPRKAFGIIPRRSETVMTFRVPAAQFDAALADLNTAGVGTVVDQEIRGRDDIERRSELTEIAQILDERLTTEPSTDASDQEAVEAQKKLQELAETANYPVIVVQINRGRGILASLTWLFVSKLTWILIGFGIGFVWMRRKTHHKPSPVIGPVEEDPRQNSPEKNPGVQDWGQTT